MIRKKQVGIRPYRDQADGQYDKYQVEKGKCIGFYSAICPTVLVGEELLTFP